MMTASPSPPSASWQPIGVDAEHAGLVAAVGRHGGGRVAALERGDGPVAGVGQLGQQVPPRVGAVGEAVQAQGQRTLVASGEVGEVHAVRRDGLV